MKNLIKKFNKWFDKVTGLTVLEEYVKAEQADIKKTIKEIDKFRSDYRQWLTDNGISIKGMNA